jgi:hypothetical protein
MYYILAGKCYVARRTCWFPDHDRQSGSHAGRSPSRKVLEHHGGLTFQCVTDPRENAFWAEVPKGWNTSGGMFRKASVDIQEAIESISPEGDIRLAWGDPSLPKFTVPNPALEFAGFREGSWYSPGYGVQLMVRRYESGAAFAEEYVRTHLAGQLGCSASTITQRAARPDLTRSIKPLSVAERGLG